MILCGAGSQPWASRATCTSTASSSGRQASLERQGRSGSGGLRNIVSRQKFRVGIAVAPVSSGAGGVVFGIVGSFDKVGFSGSTGPGARSAFHRERQLQRPERSSMTPEMRREKAFHGY